MKKIIVSLLFTLGAVSSANAVEGDAAAGKTKAAVCGSCHGANGISASGTFPNLAGQHDAYIIKQLTDFKAGKRSNPMMSPMAANLSEQDIADLAAHFSSLPRVVAAPAASESATPAPVAAGNVSIVTSTTAKALYVGDVKLGHEKSAMCASCHGADGNSLVSTYPKLAGQSANYIAKQLANFKSGERKDPVMSGMVAALSEKDMQDLAAFFAVQKRSEGTGEGSEAGHKLYFGGNENKRITACVACHGVDGKGMAQAGFPSIAGQQPDYLKKQILSFRSATRANDRNKMMQNIAIKLSDNDIDNIVKYVSSLK